MEKPPPRPGVPDCPSWQASQSSPYFFPSWGGGRGMVSSWGHRIPQGSGLPDSYHSACSLFVSESFSLG